VGVKSPGREADHSHPTSAEVKNAWSYTSTLQYAFMVWSSVKAMLACTVSDVLGHLPYIKTGCEHGDVTFTGQNICLSVLAIG
jgi:hypothetical protein